MNNKILFIPITILFLVLGLFISCDDDDEFKEVAVTPVKTLYEPAEDKYLALQSGGNTYFEWENSTAADNGVVYYDVLFDKANGDFSQPVYVVAADNKGTTTGATITHKTLNKIARLAGIEQGIPGTLKWTVRSNRGLTFTLAEQSRNISLLRLVSVDELEGAKLFITGEGSLEDGQEFVVMPNSTSEYAIFTRLEANKSYYFYSDRDGEKRTFTLDANKTSFMETSTTPEGVKESATGIYHIQLDFDAASAVVQKIDKVDFFMCSPEQRIEMPYIGKGVWKVENIKPNFHTPWGDDRYFYWMIIDGKQYKLGSKNIDNQPPSSLSGPYFNIGYWGTNDHQWEYSFKFPGEMRNAAQGTVIVDMILYLDRTDYTNEIVKKY